MKSKNRIERKEAIKKIGKYLVITSVATFIVLNPKKSQASSGGPPDVIGDPFGL